MSSFYYKCDSSQCLLTGVSSGYVPGYGTVPADPWLDSARLDVAEWLCHCTAPSAEDHTFIARFLSSM